MTFCISFTKIRNRIMSKKTALIIWVGWQDGTILRDFLTSKNYVIIWISRNKNTYHWIVGTEKHTDILDTNQVDILIKRHKPDEIYYLAAYHHSSQDIIPNDQVVFKESTNIHVNGYFNILQAVAKYSPKSKICYASSCLIYGWSDTQQQNEKTLPAPNSIYAITKLEGMHLGNRFAEKYNIQVINTILYNHESQFRSANFVSMKIIQWAIKISQWIQNTITLGDISTQVDRGYAWDYIEAMFWLLQSDKKWDYIVSSWSLHTIQDLIEIVFNYLGLDWKKHIIIDKNIIQRKKWLLYGDTIKIIKDINWKPKIWFNKMILEMTKKAKKYMK